MLAKFSPNKREVNLLKSQGLPGYLFRHPVIKDITTYLRSYIHTREGMSPKTITKEQQIKMLEAVQQTESNPTPFIACVASEPNDLVAKMFAASVMLCCLRGAKKWPRWHNVYGGFEDSLKKTRLSKDLSNNDGLIILSNVPDNSTNQKFEMLRDLLELNPDNSVLVVTTGSDPISFFNYLGYPLHYHAWFRSERIIKAI